MRADGISSSPGSLAQVRATVHEIVRFAKLRGTAVFLVGHVTKEGQIAGPRVVEHMVDTLLYFAGQSGHHFRILRASKNRFGPADEIGVFEISGGGLIGVENPSAVFLAERGRPTPGSVVFAGIEGPRSLLVEVQVLVAHFLFSTPRRTVIGWDSGRMAMVLAVLESRCGISFQAEDVNLNIAGGIRITEPAADLALAGALVSALHCRPLSANAAIFGKISLSGSIRAVPQPEQRLKEAQKLGFDRDYVPGRTKQIPLAGVQMTRLSGLAEFMRKIIVSGSGNRAVTTD